jgi:hypothetical protein
MLDYEKEKIKGAVRTDMILSGEIIVITLGIVANSDFLSQVIVVAGIAFAMTAGVYGLVAAIVKLDDAGLYLARTIGEGFWLEAKRWFGLRLVSFAPMLMKGLAFVGTIAMFMVGGGILVHGFHPAQQWVEQFAIQLSSVAVGGGVLHAITPTLFSILIGVMVGGVTVGLAALWQTLRPKA